MKIFQSLKNLLLPSWSFPEEASAGPEPQKLNQAQRECRAESAPHNPTAHAFGETFASRHGASEQTVFQSIPSDGVLTEKNEEWFREGNGMRTITMKGLVVTCSGDVVSSEQIKARCATCGGFDSIVSRCSRCNVTLCRLHSCALKLPAGPIVLCTAHYKDAVHNFDVWAAQDHARNKSSNE